MIYKPAPITWCHPFYCCPAMIVLMLGLNVAAWGHFQPNLFLWGGILVQLGFLWASVRSRRRHVEFYRRLNAARSEAEVWAVLREYR